MKRMQNYGADRNDNIWRYKNEIRNVKRFEKQKKAMDESFETDITGKMRSKFPYTPDEVLSARFGFNSCENYLQKFLALRILIKYDNREYATEYLAMVDKTKKVGLNLSENQKKYADMNMLERAELLNSFRFKEEHYVMFP